MIRIELPFSNGIRPNTVLQIHPLPLSQADLFTVDSFLKDAIDSFNINISPEIHHIAGESVSIDSFIIKPEKYRYQYFPYRDVNGEKIIFVSGFTSKLKTWNTKPFIPKLHFGLTYMELKVNLSTRRRDNLRSGDYG
ncbi:MAG: hypothetical protein WDO19_03200 [Bacteroidota bacterium]